MKVVSLQAPWFPLIIQTTVVNVSGHLSSEGPSSVQSDFFQSASVDIEPSGISIHVRFCQNSHQFCTEVHTYTTLNHTAFYELVSLNVSHVVFFFPLPQSVYHNNAVKGTGRRAADEISKHWDKSDAATQWRGKTWRKFSHVWRHRLLLLTLLIMKLSLTSINSRRISQITQPRRGARDTSMTFYWLHRKKLEVVLFIRWDHTATRSITPQPLESVQFMKVVAEDCTASILDLFKTNKTGHISGCALFWEFIHKNLPLCKATPRWPVVWIYSPYDSDYKQNHSSIYFITEKRMK